MGALINWLYLPLLGEDGALYDGLIVHVCRLWLGCKDKEASCILLYEEHDIIQ